MSPDLESRSVGAGIVGDPRLAPAGVIPPLPSGGDGNVPTTPGGGKLPGGRGPGARSFSAPQEFASAAFSASVAGLLVRRYRRVTMYRTSGFDGVVRLVAKLLFRVSRIARGSVVYVNAGKLVRYLGLDAPFHPIDLSVIYSLMEKLGFDVVKASRGKAVVVRTDHPLIEEVRNAENVNDVIKILKTRLGE